MNISSINPINFNGMWEPVKKFQKEKGFYNRDKVIYTVYDYVYHPWDYEIAGQIKREVKKHTNGRRFSLWDNFDGHHKADMVQINRIKVGEPIKREDMQKHLAKGYTETFTGGVASDKIFRKIYPNAAYSAFDVNKLSQRQMAKYIEKYFSES